jgi:predicted permease
MDDEIQFHLDMRVGQLTARGWSPDAARTEAARMFGPLPELRRDLHAAARRREEILTMSERLDALRHDLEYARRQIRRSPGLAAAVIATFALGIGANATMFGIIDRLLLRPPAHVVGPEQLYRVELSFRWDGEEHFNSSFSYPGYVDVRDGVPAFAGVAMHTYPNPVSLGLGGDARKVDGVMVSGTYFGTLGVRATLGRLIGPGDDVLPNGSRVAVIGYGLWQREFGGERDVVGREIELAGRKFAIVGVAPQGFVGTGSKGVDVWIPVSAGEGLRFAGENWAKERRSSWMTVVARLKPGLTEDVAASQITAAYRAGTEADGAKVDTTARGRLTSVLPSKQRTLSRERKVAILLGGVSVLVLLIACANVANLLLVRAFTRRREVAVRLALGIPRGRLVRQLVTEAVVLAVLGGLAALAVVQWGSALVQKVLLADFAWPDAAIDGRVLAFTAAATVAVGLLTGLVPALQGSAPDLARTLKEGGRGTGVARSRTRTFLLVIQAAVSVILLVGTGLFVRSLRNVHGVELGVDVNRLVIASIDLRSVGIDSVRANEYFRLVREAAARLPGVAAATVAEAPPFSDWSMGIGIKVPGSDSVVDFDNGPLKHVVQPEYFAAVGTRIVRGRAFEDSDTRPGAPPVTIINERVARALWPREQAIGRCIQTGEKDSPCFEVVGIAQDTHRGSVVEDNDLAQVYLPLGRVPPNTRARFLLVRPTGEDPDVLIEPVRRVMQTVMSGLPYANVRPMRSALDTELRAWELGATMFAAFGLIALVLSSLGLYSVVAYSVAQRMHEMGVRVALGARANDIRGLVLRQGLRVAALGLAGGVVLALGAGRFVEPLLFQTSTRDPLVYGAVLVVLLAVATVASLVPARRATRADPLTALRAE